METRVAELVDGNGRLIDEGVDVADAVIEPPVMIDEGVVLSPGSTIGPRAVLGSNSVVAQRASVTDSVLLPGCEVGADASVHEAILSAGVKVSSGARLDPGSVIGEGELVGTAA